MGRKIPEEVLHQLLVGFATDLRGQRLAVGLTQKALARRAGLHPSHVSALECAKHEPGSDTLVRLASALDVPVDHFFQTATKNFVFEPERGWTRK